MNELINSKTKKSFFDWISIYFDEQKNRLLTYVENSKKKIDNWQIVIFANSRLLSLIHDHFRKFHDTLNENKMQSSFSKKKIFIHANSRSFSLIYVVSWRFVLLFHSRKFVLWFRDFFRKNFRFVDLKMFYVNFIQFTKIRFVVSWFFLRKLFDDFIFFIRVFRQTIHSKQKIWTNVN